MINSPKAQETQVVELAEVLHWPEVKSYVKHFISETILCVPTESHTV